MIKIINEVKSLSITKVLRNNTLHKIAGAIITQGILSVTNLIIGILIARSTIKEEYALYIIAFNLIQGAISYQNALINTPLIVLSPSKESRERENFINGLCFGQWFYFLPIITLVLISGLFLSFYQNDFLRFKQLSILSIAILACFSREFLRTVSYSILHIRIVIIMDVVFIISVLPIMGLLVFFNKLSSMSAISALACGYSFSAFIGHLTFKIDYKLHLSIIKKSLKEAWRQGRWALIGVTATIIMNQGYLYIVSFMVGLHETANISAARLFLMPVAICTFSSTKIIVAKGANILSNKGGERNLIYLISLISFFLFMFWFLLVIFLYSTYSNLLELFFKGKYSEVGWYIYLWAIFFLVQLFRFPVSNSLLVLKDFKVLAKYVSISAVITIMSCYILIKLSSGYGAIISLTAGEIILLIFCIHRIVQRLKEYTIN